MELFEQGSKASLTDCQGGKDDITTNNPIVGKRWNKMVLRSENYIYTKGRSIHEVLTVELKSYTSCLKTICVLRIWEWIKVCMVSTGESWFLPC